MRCNNFAFIMSIFCFFSACDKGNLSPDKPVAENAYCFTNGDSPSGGNEVVGDDGDKEKCGCPVIIKPMLGTCSEGRIVRPLLVCGGQKKTMFITNSNSRPDQPEYGTTRITLQFEQGSRFQGSLITPDPGCWISDGTDIDFTFGAVWIGDLGEETVDGAPQACVVQSKMEFTSFNFDLVGNAIHEGFMKNKLHESIDDVVMDQLYKKKPGRCVRWRLMP
jgi:hypothetical protein